MRKERKRRRKKLLERKREEREGRVFGLQKDEVYSCKSSCNCNASEDNRYTQVNDKSQFCRSYGFLSSIDALFTIFLLLMNNKLHCKHFRTNLKGAS